MNYLLLTSRGTPVMELPGPTEWDALNYLFGQYDRTVADPLSPMIAQRHPGGIIQGRIGDCLFIITHANQLPTCHALYSPSLTT